MKVNTIYHGDCIELMDKLPENYIDLIITSPPYSDIKKYGKDINILHPDRYVDWFLSVMHGVQRILKPTGSFILNINDRCVKKQRHIYVHDLICRTVRETNLKFYDSYFWFKKGGVIPNGGPKRLNNNMEYILHFCKDVDRVKWNMDNVREPYTEGSINRFKKPMLDYITTDSGEQKLEKKRKWKYNEKGKVPNNLFTFPTNSGTRGKIHPAPFNVELPNWFIKALSYEGDIIIDIFMGSGTTAISAVKNNRLWIGFEKNLKYVEIARERIKKEMRNIDNIFFI